MNPETLKIQQKGVNSSYQRAWDLLTKSRDHLSETRTPTVGDCGLSLTAGAVPGRIAPANSWKNPVISPNDSWEQETQIKFGSLYKITARSDDAKWIRVRLSQTECAELWIESHRHTYLPRDVFKLLIDEKDLLPTQQNPRFLVSVVDFEGDQPIKIERGAKLPLYHEKTQTCLGPNLSLLRILLPTSHIEVGADRTISNLIKTIRSQLGQSYVWGGLDCSTFVYNIFSGFGVELPQNSAMLQAKSEVGTKVASLPGTQTGDLVFYGASTVAHVGVVIRKGGDLYLAHAKQRTRIEKMDPRSGLTKCYCGEGRRILSIKRVCDFE